MKKAIRDIQIGDLVLGTDGKFHKVIDKTKAKLSYNMYEIEMSCKMDLKELISILKILSMPQTYLMNMMF